MTYNVSKDSICISYSKIYLLTIPYYDKITKYEIQIVIQWIEEFSMTKGKPQYRRSVNSITIQDIGNLALIDQTRIIAEFTQWMKDQNLLHASHINVITY
jgi:hypothetical protein